MRILAAVMILAVFGAACGGTGLDSTGDTGVTESNSTTAVTPTTQSSSQRSTQSSPQPSSTQPAAPQAPTNVPTGPLEPEVSEALASVFDHLGTGVNMDAIGQVGASGDARLAWLMSDLLRFLGPGSARDSVMAAFSDLTGVSVSEFSPWVESANLLIGWNLDAPPDYRQLKGKLFTTIDERWSPFFVDDQSEIDYRLLNWGGVRPDDRPLGDFEATCRGGCIPALDDPAVTDANGGDWYPDEAVIFGVLAGGAARAYPKNIMEIHEMIIDTVGGVRIGMPYCTLCGSAQAYDLESVPAGVSPPVLRTSGLLSRSNKVMYDLGTWSAFDTFTGEAVSGPLREAGVRLEQLTVVTTTWGEWKRAHPETTIVAEDGGIGRSYAADPLGGRDDNGPIFPVGPVDSRLPVQEQVLGVETPDGQFVAFPVTAARNRIADGEAVGLAGVVVLEHEGGLTAELSDGTKLVTHQAFWFAWSQFHPDTDVWVDSGL